MVSRMSAPVRAGCPGAILFWLGLPDLTRFTSADYFPVMPWVFLFWCGVFLARLWRPGRGEPPAAPSAGFEDAAPEGGSGHTAHLSGRGNAPKDRLAAAEHPHAAYDDAQEDVSAEIAEDFDLRRAVIYSEILKPKFDE